MHKLVRTSLGAGVALVTVGLGSAPAHAHSIPRLYAELGPATAWDPVSAHVFTGGTFMLGLGVDPEHDALIARAEFYAAWGGSASPLYATGGSVLYRLVLGRRSDVVWTVAMGPGLLAADEKDVRWGVGGVRGELGVRFGNNVGLTAYALTGLLLGDGVRVPVGGPFGLALELGAP